MVSSKAVRSYPHIDDVIFQSDAFLPHSTAHPFFAYTITARRRPCQQTEAEPFHIEGIVSPLGSRHIRIVHIQEPIIPVEQCA